MATYAEAIAGAHRSLNDRAKVRYPDTDTFAYAVDAIREIATYRPDLFTQTKGFACDPKAMQTVAPEGLYVLDVLGIVGGRAITKTDGDTLRRSHPEWETDAQAPAEHWWPVINDQTKRPQAEFFIYPRSPNGQNITVQFVRNPFYNAAPVISGDMPVPDHLLPAIESYIIFRCEMADDEHVNIGRAQSAYTNFANAVGIDEKARKTIVQEGRSQ